MNLSQFHEKYADARSHDKIKINCDGCGRGFEPLKTRAQQTITKRGQYLCPSCGQAAKHAAKPVTEKTKAKIAKGVHEARFKKLIADLESQVGRERVLAWDLVMDANWKGGVLWTVETLRNGRKTIIANYFDWYPKIKAWCFKEIDEVEGPVAVNCPVSFLKKAPETDPAWRKRVRAFHQQAGAKPPMPKIVEDWLKG